MTGPGFTDAEVAITSAFAAEWTATDAAAIHWPNEAGFVPPIDAPWVRLAIQWGSTGQRVALGPRMDRYSGQVVAQCFVPLGLGNGACTALCDAAASIFRPGRVIHAGGRIKFLTGGMPVVGGDGRWWQQNATCPFLRDRT